MSLGGRLAWGAVVLIVLAAGASGYLRPPLLWTPDGAIYARMMLVDRGIAPAEAKAVVERAIRETPELVRLTGPRAPRWFDAQVPLFGSRPLVPYLASLLYARFGLAALAIVNAAAFVLCGIALYALLLRFGRPWAAAVVATACMFTAPIPIVAHRPLTDVPALLLWIGIFAAMLAFVESGRRTLLAAAAAAIVLLALTRPAPQLALGSALGILAATRRTETSVRSRARVLGATVVLLTIGSFAAGAALHATSIGDQLRWQYAFAREEAGVSAPFGEWYVRKVATAAAEEVASIVTRGAPLALIAFAVCGFVRRRGDAVIPLVAGAALADLAVIFVNPSGLDRPFELPLFPLAAIGVTIALEAAAGSRGSGPRLPIEDV